MERTPPRLRYPVSSGYFETVGLAIIRGRPIEASDIANLTPQVADAGSSVYDVAVVSETMARTLWPDGDGLGECLRLRPRQTECTTVVGVAEDADVALQRSRCCTSRFILGGSPP